MPANPFRLAGTAVVLFAAASTPAAAGPLDPPAGPVSPTLKTLSEVEPRIAVSAVNTPGTVSATFRISQPGSYYLTGNVVGETQKHGIQIAADGVTLDLNGFTLRGIAGSLDGINVATFSENVVIRNGHIRAWGESGIRSLIDIGRIEGITVADNGGWGIDNASNGTFTTHIIRCEAFRNGGMVADTGNFRGGSNTVITGCVSYDATGDGIVVGQASLVEGCLSFACSGDGIVAGSGSTVRSCSSSFHDNNGIVVANDSVAVGNTCDQNGRNATDGAAILVTGTDNRLEGNTCTDSDRGIDVDGLGNFIARNTCSGNAVNWDIAAGNVCLVVQAVVGTAFSGNTGGVPPGSTDPNANFTY